MTPRDIATKLARTYPKYIGDGATLDARIDDLQRVVGHLTPEQLAMAYDAVMSKWLDQHKPPLPAHFKQAAEGWIAPRATDTTNMKAMSQALPGLCRDIERGWRMASSDWCNKLVEDFAAANPGHEEAARKYARYGIDTALHMTIHAYAQRVWRGTHKIEDFRLTDEAVGGYIGKPGPIDPYFIAIQEGREPPRYRPPSRTAPASAKPGSGRSAA